jgi:hypothetical protein
MSVPFFAKALFDYEAVEASELTVVTGDFLTVEEVNESGWCLVSRQREQTTGGTQAQRERTGERQLSTDYQSNRWRDLLQSSSVADSLDERCTNSQSSCCSEIPPVMFAPSFAPAPPPLA